MKNFIINRKNKNSIDVSNEIESNTTVKKKKNNLSFKLMLGVNLTTLMFLGYCYGYNMFIKENSNPVYYQSRLDTLNNVFFNGKKDLSYSNLEIIDPKHINNLALKKFVINIYDSLNNVPMVSNITGLKKSEISRYKNSLSNDNSYFEKIYGMDKISEDKLSSYIKNGYYKPRIVIGEDDIDVEKFTIIFNDKIINQQVDKEQIKDDLVFFHELSHYLTLVTLKKDSADITNVIDNYLNEQLKIENKSNLLLDEGLKLNDAMSFLYYESIADIMSLIIINKYYDNMDISKSFNNLASYRHDNLYKDNTIYDFEHYTAPNLNILSAVINEKSYRDEIDFNNLEELFRFSSYVSLLQVKNLIDNLDIKDNDDMNQLKDNYIKNLLKYSYDVSSIDTDDLLNGYKLFKKYQDLNLENLKTINKVHEHVLPEVTISVKRVKNN